MTSLHSLARMMSAEPLTLHRQCASHSASQLSQRPLCAARMQLRHRPTDRSMMVMAEREDSEGDASDNTSDYGTSQIPDFLPSSSGDWREFRAKLVGLESNRDSEVEMWAHSVPGPETGCILVAHPLMFTASQTYFHQAVILLFFHEEGQGSCGLILNRPTEYPIDKIAGLEELRPAFADSILYLGGDVGENTLHCLHPYDLPGSLQVVNGVHLGGLDAAKAMIESGQLQQKEFKFFCRYAGWGSGQLQQECKSGVWLTAAASPSFILQHDKDGADMWHQALQLMGGEFAQLSEAMKDTYDPNVMEYGPEEPQDGQA